MGLRRGIGEMKNGRGHVVLLFESVSEIAHGREEARQELRAGHRPQPVANLHQTFDSKAFVDAVDGFEKAVAEEEYRVAGRELQVVTVVGGLSQHSWGYAG